MNEIQKEELKYFTNLLVLAYYFSMETEKYDDSRMIIFESLELCQENKDYEGLDFFIIEQLTINLLIKTISSNKWNQNEANTSEIKVSN